MASSSKTYWGADRSYTLTGLNVSVDDLGILRVSETYTCKDQSACRACLNFSASDCTVPIQRPLRIGSSANRLEAGWWEATREFQGIISESAVTEDSNKRYRLTTRTNLVPIDAHPNFASFALPPGTNRSWFDPTNGNFVEFRCDPAGVPNPKQGVTDFHSPVVVMTERKLLFVEDLEQELNRLNKIDDPPGLPHNRVKPNFPKRNWLVTEITPNRIAHEVYEITTTWALSGPYGWNPYIYYHYT